MTTAPKATLAELEAFLSRYRAHSAGLQHQRLEEFTKQFEKVRESWKPLENEWEEFKKAAAPELNIFDILRVKHDEVRTHSGMLRWLLDPRASHAQGSLFLDGFLVDCIHVATSTSKDWRCRAELPTPTGRIDLVLSSSEERRLVVIENKIYAMEQRRQLERYADWMSTRERSFDPQKMRLVFLTLDGHPSLTAAGNAYMRLAYRTDILDWLNAVVKHVRATNLTSLIQQYMETIRRL